MQAMKTFKVLALAGALTLSPMAFADDDRDIEGTIQSIDQQSRSFVVNGETFLTDDRTDYDDELKSFSDLKTGQRVEVDYVVRDGKRYAKEIELDD